MIARSGAIPPRARRVAALLLAWLAIGLVAGEGFARAIEKPEHARLVRYALDEAAGYTLRPGVPGRYRTTEFDQAFSANALGLRGREPTVPRPPDEWRILVLGDSFTFAGEVPESARFTERLEAHLHAAGRHQARVVNAGVPGWGTVNQAGFFRSRRDLLHPNLVIVALHVGNDLADNVVTVAGGYEARGDTVVGAQRGKDLLRASEAWTYRPLGSGTPARDAPDGEQWRAGDPLPTSAPVPSAAGHAAEMGLAVPDALPLADRLKRESRLYRLAQESKPYVWLQQTRRGPVVEETPAVAAAPRLNLLWALALGLEPVPPRYWHQVAYPLLEAHLRQVRDEAASVGAQTLVLVIPYVEQVDSARRSDLLRALALDAGAVDHLQPQRAIAQVASELGLDVVDLTPVFIRRAAEGPFFFPADKHFTTAGHRVTSETLLGATLAHAGGRPRAR